MPRRTLGFLFVIVAILAVPALSFGQWLKYPTDGVPKNADGTPNLKCPNSTAAQRKARLLGALACHKSRPVRWRRLVSSSSAATRSAGRRLAATSDGTCPSGLPYQPQAAEARKGAQSG